MLAAWAMNAWAGRTLDKGIKRFNIMQKTLAAIPDTGKSRTVRDAPDRASERASEKAPLAPPSFGAMEPLRDTVGLGWGRLRSRRGRAVEGARRLLSAALSRINAWRGAATDA